MRGLMVAGASLVICAASVAADAQQQNTNTAPSSMSLADYARRVQQPAAASNSAAPGGAPSAAPDGQSVADVARGYQGRDLARSKVSPEEARKILDSVDPVLKFASEDSGFPIRASVKRRMIPRETLVSVMQARKMDDESAKRLQGSELTLKKFGYLPKVFSTTKFVEGMYAEQTAGFYDPRTKTISLMDWVKPEEQLDVLAHELTHALQDQNFNLINWQRISAGRHPAFQVTANEALAESEARRAVVEGQAMIVLVDHQFDSRGMDIRLEHAPGASEAAAQYLSMVPAPDTPVIHAAPVFLRDAMLFPYREGMLFEMELLNRGGKALAFNKVFERPPVNTHEIMHPQSYIGNEKMHVPHIPDVSALLADKYEAIDYGGLGELDLRSLIKQLGNTRLAESITRGWRGTSYLTVKRKDVNLEKATTADVAVLFISSWDTPEIARHFASFYADAVPRRYTQASAISGSCTGQDCPLERYQFNTEEGLVSIECRPNNLVVITESFESNLATSLNAALLRANSGHITAANDSPALPDLSLRYAQSPIFAGLSGSWEESMVKAIVNQGASIRQTN